MNQTFYQRRKSIDNAYRRSDLQSSDADELQPHHWAVLMPLWSGASTFILSPILFLSLLHPSAHQSPQHFPQLIGGHLERHILILTVCGQSQA
jgi:hypothetical protein